MQKSAKKSNDKVGLLGRPVQVQTRQLISS